MDASVYIATMLKIIFVEVINMIDNKFKYEIIKPLGVLSSINNYSKEVNIISFNGNEPKLDIRTWHTDSNGKELRKGVTLSHGELIMLIDIIKGIKNIEDLFEVKWKDEKFI